MAIDTDGNGDRGGLGTLDPAAFRSVLRSFVAAHWSVDPSALEVSPPSPDRGIDVVAPGDLLVHARQHSGGRVGATAIRDLAALGDRRSVDALAVVTTTGFTDGAVDCAADADIERFDGDRFRTLLAEYGIEIPASDDRTDLRATVAELSAYWPESLRGIARDVAARIDALGAFEYAIERADYSTDLNVVPADADRSIAKLRFSTAGLLVYVRRGDDWQRAVAVSAHGDHRPPDLLDRVQRAIEESFEAST